MSDQLPAVYVETSVISYIVSRRNAHDVLIAGHQALSVEWWTRRRTNFRLFSSIIAANEARKGDPALAAKRLELLAEMTSLEVTDDATNLAVAILRETSMPRKADVDALHVAIAAVHGMDLLVTWNCKHIANANLLPSVYSVCRDYGFEPPLICTPWELMGNETS